MSKPAEELARQILRLRARLRDLDNYTLGIVLEGGTQATAGFAQRHGCGDLSFTVIDLEFSRDAIRRLKGTGWRSS